MQVRELLRQMPGSLEPAKVLILPIKVNTVAAENLGICCKDLNMPSRHLLPLLLIACAPPAGELETSAIDARDEPIYYGQTSPTLYTSLTTAQQNVVVSV